MKLGTKIGLFIGVFFLVVSIFLFLILKHKVTTPLDYPYNLSDKEEVIEVHYVNYACDCAQWIETKYSKSNPDYVTNEKDCIYLESENPQLQEIEDKFMEDYFSKKLKLTGSFYTNKGLSRTYYSQFEKPDPARVFRYSKIEIIK